MGDEERRRPAGGGDEATGNGAGPRSSAGGDGGDEASTLREELLRLRGRQLDTSPLAEVAAYDAAAAAAAEARVVETALQPGQYAGPASRKVRELAGLGRGQGGGALIVTWHLSGRSPFCRATLAAWDRAVLQGAVIASSPASTATSAPPGARRTAPAPGSRPAAPATLIVLTAEAPEAAAETRTALGLHFPLLHDDGSAADAFQIRYPGPLEFGELLGLLRDRREPLFPLPACYVVTEDGRISWSFLHPDPRYRSEPYEAVRAARE